jgi:hypothetical protein
MSDEDNEEETMGERGDSFLEQLALMADEQGLTQPVVLHVSGMIVTGRLVGRKAFAEGTKALDEGVAKAWDSQTPSRQPRHVHLENATIYHNGREISVAWWRGEIANIEAMALGLQER